MRLEIYFILGKLTYSINNVVKDNEIIDKENILIEKNMLISITNERMLILSHNNGFLKLIDQEDKLNLNLVKVN